MEYRRLGRTHLQVSVIGFGTCQLRLTPEKQAIDTLLRGFDLGVNIVHTAPDYGNAEEVVAKAVRQRRHNIIVASQGYDVPGNKSGPVFHFERLFETTCKRLGTELLDLYGIACIDDREAHQENVWGKSGMIEFLLKKKEQGRLRGIFCTTHGKPEYVKQLVTCGIFDAVILAYNILGYHLLTCNPPSDRHFESLPRNQQEIFPLCREHDVGLMIMKPLGGGLLSESKAFPPRHNEKRELKNTRAGDILRSILLNPEVACVLPGTASVAEAEENALSGNAPINLGADQQMRLKEFVNGLRKRVCSRCGACDTLCSQGLPISWTFRAGLINLYPAALFEQPENMEYFRLHPRLEPICAACPNMTCACPDGINIPQSLKEIHTQMVDLMHQRLIPPPDNQKGRIYGDHIFGARIASMDIPKVMEPGETYLCRLHLENAGNRGWFPETKGEHTARGLLGVFIEEKRIYTIAVTQDVHMGSRWHFLFEITAPRNVDRFCLRLQLLFVHQQFAEAFSPILFSQNISIGGASCAQALSSGTLSQDLTQYRKDPNSARSHFFKRIANRVIRNNVIRLSNMGYRNKSLFRFLKKPLHTKIGQVLKSRLDAYCLMASVEGTDLKGSNSPVSPQPYDVTWLENNLPASIPKGEPYQVYLRVKNRGSRHWHACHPEGKCVELVVYIGDALHSTSRIPRDVDPGESVFLTIRLTFPDTAENGKWRITFSFVEQNVAWFHQNGMTPLVVDVRAEEPERGAIARASTIARRSNWGFWQPSEGIARSRTGCRYPLFIKHAQGCRVRDAEGNEWIDYVMAGGSAVLGYAHPEIQEAISQQLDSSAIVTLPHMLEIQVTQMLCDMIPCAEMVLFGKHGSDMCTAAIRIARLHTGRTKVLFSGYHGWHDWYAETLQPKLKISSEPSTLLRFELNDLSSFRSLVKGHSGEIAAVILEPAAQAATLDGPVCEADPAFLRRVAQICRQERCVLIFDEIVTGFRHPRGSVQQATGVIPDLTCLGKALSAGMPLSALVGRREIMKTSLQAVYMPTFRGEVYSLAAAVAALRIYQNRDVPRKIHDFGLALKNAINLISRELNVPGEMIGMPYRMIYRFYESDALQRALKRTLLQQELLQRGILTFKGYMLPSTAHGEMEMEQTISAFRGALKRVQEASSKQAFVRYLDIPLI